MPPNQSIFLIGPMGAGKTSIGRQLARRLHAPFYDSDRVLEQHTGVDIPTIFAYEGEEGFRKRESRVIDELTQRKNIVLATGGGAILIEDNRNALKSRGVVVYLRVSVDTQLERTSHDRNRPLLNSGDRRQTLEDLQKQRNPFYEDLADIAIDTDNNNMMAVINEIQKNITLLESNH